MPDRQARFLAPQLGTGQLALASLPVAISQRYIPCTLVEGSSSSSGAPWGGVGGEKQQCKHPDVYSGDDCNRNGLELMPGTIGTEQCQLHIHGVRLLV